MKSIITSALFAFASLGAAAQTPANHAGHHDTKPETKVAQAAPAPAPAAKTDMAEGEIRKIDKDAKKVTLKHGPIKNLDMPGMTMVFQVKDMSLMDKLAVGDKILFTAEQQQGAYVVTGAEKAPK
jgi:Cu(I)/Ag(I) efflux system periplasmic protein CusF